MLKSLLGEIQPLEGSVERGEHLFTGYFEQEVKESNNNTCIEEVWVNSLLIRSMKSVPLWQNAD